MQFFTKFKNTYLCWLFTFVFCGISFAQKPHTKKNNVVKPAASLTKKYLNKLKTKNIGIVANQTSIIKSKDNRLIHLVDSLLSLNISVKKVFAPEHGFRGKADAGEIIKNGKDNKTNLPIISLYGKNKKPTAAQLANLDLVIFDIQDVGVRFYTYISTLHYVMEACAEQNIPILVLDRPNPNAHYIDGPVLEKSQKSFVGMHPVPVVYGMTIGEYAQMINGENWLKNKIQCDLTVMPIENYTHNTKYSLPIKPSPNLPNSKSINLYPSLCLFEGTTISVGRGTDKQFQIFGHPAFSKIEYPFSFTPKPNEGAKNPKHKNQICFGNDLRKETSLDHLRLKWLIASYKNYQELNIKNPFFNTFFTKLAGTARLQKQIELGISAHKIRLGWKKALQNFLRIRAKYLIYE